MNRLVQWVLTGVVSLFLLALILGQFLVPIVASDVSHQMPEVRHLVAPYSVLGIVTIACIQGAVIFLYLAVSRRTKDSFFTNNTRMWIFAAGLLCTVAFLIPAGTAIHLLSTVHAGGPGVVLGLAASLVAATGFGCLTYIALKAFDGARTEHEELGGVI